MHLPESRSWKVCQFSVQQYCRAIYKSSDLVSLTGDVGFLSVSLVVFDLQVGQQEHPLNYFLSSNHSFSPYPLWVCISLSTLDIFICGGFHWSYPTFLPRVFFFPECPKMSSIVMLCGNIMHLKKSNPALPYVCKKMVMSSSSVSGRTRGH